MHINTPCLPLNQYSFKKKRGYFEKHLDFIRNVHNENNEGEIRTDRREDYLEVIMS